MERYLSIIGVVTFVFAMVACSAEPAVTLEKEWVLSGFDSPECVMESDDGSFLYVSNVNGDGSDVDGNGYIARISLDGKLLENDWVTGLNAPKGMALADGILFVSDIDHLVKIDVSTQEILERIPVEGAVFLNDVAVIDGGVLVSDSANARIYHYADGEVTVWLENDQLSGVNGLTPQNDRLLLTTMEAGELIAVDFNSKEMSVIADGMKNADGIKQYKDGSYIVSSWPGKLYRVTADGEKAVLLDTEENTILLNDFTLVGNTLVVPNWRPGTVRAFRLVKE